MRTVRSPNHGAREGTNAPDIVVLHYTEMRSADAAVRWLCNPASKVSAHWLIASDGTLVQMVDEERRAWHAGVSHWDGSRDVNSRSIGIELDSLGHAPAPPLFPEAQIAALCDLLSAMRTRWPIAARNVVAHSDVAPERKIDPGEAFPWATLAAEGHVIEVSAGTQSDRPLAELLADCGYGVPPTGPPPPPLVRAFHRRRRPDAVERPADTTTHCLASALADEVAADRRAHPGPFGPVVTG